MSPSATMWLIEVFKTFCTTVDLYSTDEEDISGFDRQYLLVDAFHFGVAPNVLRKGKSNILPDLSLAAVCSRK